jgi:hypothetical protein
VGDLATGLLARQIGSDTVLLQATPFGFAQTPLVFFFESTDCSGQRHLENRNGAGFAYAGQVSGGAVVYTRLVDPFLTVSLVARSYEALAVDQDPDQRGACTEFGGATMSMGPAVVVRDPAVSALAAPFRLRH